ncbi:MAG TPA: MBL fold metallo-hydrolase [bacterium]|nr:MBL fold metallo-hydrolase [bacterium]
MQPDNPTSGHIPVSGKRGQSHRGDTSTDRGEERLADVSPVQSPFSGHVPSDRMVILGSGGARIVVAKQLRSSGGIWFSLGGTQFLLDPGPGALVRMTGSRHKLDPTKLSGILLSHRHLDHSGDVNNMIEAMTMGGTEPRGALFAPSDALGGDDPVVLKYVRPFLERVVTTVEGGSYELGNVRFTCPVRHQHRGEVYGFRFQTGGLSADYTDGRNRSEETADVADDADGAGRNRREESTDYADYTDGRNRSEETADVADDADGAGRNRREESADYADFTDSGPNPRTLEPQNPGCGEIAKDAEDSGRSPVFGLRSALTVSYIADTRYFPELAEHYRADVVIMNVVRPTPSQLDHLSAPDAEELVKAIRPKLAVMTHFGMRMLAAKPWIVAREMSERTGCRVVAASDGMLIDLEQVKESMTDSQLPVPNTGAA